MICYIDVFSDVATNSPVGADKELDKLKGFQMWQQTAPSGLF